MNIMTRLLTTLICALAFCSSAIAQPKLLDEVTAIVNQGVVLKSEVQELILQTKERFAKAGQAIPDDAILFKQAREYLIRQELQLQVAQRQGLQVSSAQLEQAVQTVASNNKQSVAEFKKTLQSQGLNFAEFRQQLKNELLINEIQRIALTSKINITDSEVDQLVKYLNSQGNKEVQYRIGHIEISLEDKAKARLQQAAKVKATKLLRELKNGANFTDLAVKQSNGPKALQGGDWGWMNQQEMPTLFEDAVKNAKKGDIIGPLRTGSGLHIIKIIDIRGLDKVMETKVKVRQILLRPSIIMSSAKAKETLADLRAKIVSGKISFAKAAKEYSQEAISAPKGGELDWSNPTLFVPAFKQAVSRLKPSQLSQPFESSLGWHLVQLEQRRTQDITGKATRQRAYQLLFNRQFSDAIPNWVDELQGQAYIKLKPLDGNKG